MQNKHSLEDLQEQRKTVERAMELDIPADERAIYKKTLESINSKIALLEKPAQKEYAPHFERRMPPEDGFIIMRHKEVMTPPKESASQPNPVGTTNMRTIFAGGHSPSNGAIKATIAAAKDSEKFNPSITITWDDGYALTVTETEARSRFKTTFRDCMALKCVSEGKPHKMWRWDTPWRCVGFLKTIAQFDNGKTPTDLRDLDYPRPTDRQKQVFELIIDAI